MTRLFLRRFGITGLARAAALLIVSANLFFLAPWLGPAPFGEYMLVSSVVTLLSWFATWGFPTTAIRWVPHYLAQNNTSDLQAFTRFARWAVASRLIGMLALALILSIVGALADWPMFCSSLWFAGLGLLAGNAVLHLLTGELQGHGQIALGQFLFDASRHTLQLAVVVGIAATAGEPLSVTAILWWQVIGTSVGILWACLALTRESDVQYPVVEVCLHTQRVSQKSPVELRAEWLSSAQTAGINAISLVYLAQIDLLVIGGWSGSEVAGPYGLATRLAGLTTFGLTTANTAMGPSLSVAAQADRCPSLQPLVTQVSVWGLAATVPLIFGIGAIGWWGAELFGSGYGALRLPLLILLVGQLLNAWCGPCLLLLNLSANGRAATKILLTTCLTQTALVCLSTPFLGPIGTAAGVSLSAIGWNLWARRACWNRLHVETAVIPRFFRSWARKQRPGDINKGFDQQPAFADVDAAPQMTHSMNDSHSGVTHSKRN